MRDLPVSTSIKDIVDGQLHTCSKLSNMFNSAQVLTILGLSVVQVMGVIDPSLAKTPVSRIIIFVFILYQYVLCTIMVFILLLSLVIANGMELLEQISMQCQ
jgi:hypothetical protein